MPTDIDERFLVEECLLEVADHLLRRCLDAEASFWLDQLGTGRKFTTRFQLLQVLVLLRTMFWVRNFIDIVSHHVLELLVSHRFGEVVEFLTGHVELLPLVKWMINLVSLLL